MPKAKCYCDQTAIYQVAVLYHDETGADSLTYWCNNCISPEIRERF